MGVDRGSAMMTRESRAIGERMDERMRESANRFVGDAHGGSLLGEIPRGEGGEVCEGRAGGAEEDEMDEKIEGRGGDCCNGECRWARDKRKGRLEREIRGGFHDCGSPLTAACAVAHSCALSEWA